MMRMKLKATALNSDLYGVSVRAAAAMVSSVLHDIGFVIKTDTSKVVINIKLGGKRATIKMICKITFNRILNNYLVFILTEEKNHTVVIERIVEQWGRNIILSSKQLVQFILVMFL
ncbi:hypothetical protein AVEN_60017-1 [Araneus ventricosus]|uniref:Uncharacterized protein n=1 Tax=Araneus ventricosus TaxID=182803 RepID=A0A4Y2CCQ9_ARAVE|nr:hypothetical protein AVEN_60017-1 [Araneus ventricosus]